MNRLAVVKFPKASLSPLIALVVLAASGCAKDSSPSGPGLALSDKDNLAQGWRQFEAQQYDSAAASFTSAYSAASTDAIKGEAVEGRGWAFMYKRNLTAARTDFMAAIGTTGIQSGILDDARAGASFTLYSLNMFSDAAAYSNAALTDNPSYAFAHDPKITSRRVRLLLAQSYYANGQFTPAAAQIDLLLPSSAPHAPDPVALLGSITNLLNSL